MKYFSILSLMLFSCWGCAQMGDMMPSQEMTAARKLFLQKKYQDAAKSFSQIRQRTKRISLQQKALLGQACSQILLAQDQAQSQEALQLWQAWCEKRANTFHTEDICALLTPVMERWIHPEKKEGVKKSHKRKSITQRLHFSKESDLTTTLANQKKELKQLRDQLAERDRNIKELNTKLKALEEINQEIEQKKKGMNFQ